MKKKKTQCELVHQKSRWKSIKNHIQSSKSLCKQIQHCYDRSSGVAPGADVTVSTQCQRRSGRLTAGRRRGVIFCLVKVFRGFEDIRVSWTCHHLLTVAVNGGANLWWAVPGLLWSGLQAGGGQRQVHHVQHVAQASGHLWSNKEFTLK